MNRTYERDYKIISGGTLRVHHDARQARSVLRIRSAVAPSEQ
jgi:hypothetical protein